jgi:hypothetical protein
MLLGNLETGSAFSVTKSALVRLDHIFEPLETKALQLRPFLMISKQPAVTL